MKLITGLPVAAVWLSVCVAPSFAQETAPPMYTQVYQVQHADAKRLATAVNGIQNVVHVGWVEGARLILQGPEEDVNRVVSTMIEPLDKPSTSLSDKTPVAVIRLPKVPSDHFMSLVQALAPQQFNTRLGFDPQNRLLVVRGPQADIESVQQLVAELSKPIRSLTVTCYFLRGKIGTAGAADGKLPEQLQAIAATLRRTGLGDASLLAPMIVNANDGGRFKSSSVLSLATSDHVPNTVQFDVAGTATITEDDQVELMIDGRVEVPGQSDEHPQATWFNVNTTIATQLGSYAVIAAAPGTTPNGDYIALVARVDAAN